jgi:hypothetical protein
MTDDARIFDAIRGGSIDTAARLLEGIHDARAGGDRTPRREALGDLVYALARAQAEALQQVLGVGAAAAPGLHASLRGALGLPQTRHTLRFGPPTVSRQRVIARNASASASALAVEVTAFVSDAGHLLDHALAVRVAERALTPTEVTDARLRFVTEAGAIAPGASATVELTLDVDAVTAQATPGVSYHATLTLSLGETAPRSLDLELTLRG